MDLITAIRAEGGLVTLKDQIATIFWILCKLNMIAMQETPISDI